MSPGVSTGIELSAAVWADEATKAANMVEAAQARRHISEDAEAAIARAAIARGRPHPGLLRRIASRLRLRHR